MAFYLWFAGVHCLSLFSSPSSEDGQVTVCPGTTVTLTCTASQVELLTWIQEPDKELCLFVPADYESEERRVIERGPYTLTLVAVDNVNGSFADLTFTLEVMVDDIEDGTTIRCDVFTVQPSQRVILFYCIIALNIICRSPISTI